jgi:hypothetical protein
MGRGGEGQGFRQSPQLACHDATRRSDLSAAERIWKKGDSLTFVALHVTRTICLGWAPLPPPLEIPSPQRIVSLQHLHYQLELISLITDASRCGAIKSITRDPYKVCFKRIEGHAVLRS